MTSRVIAAVLLAARAAGEGIPETLEALQQLKSISQPARTGASVGAQGAVGDANAAIAAKAVQRRVHQAARVEHDVPQQGPSRARTMPVSYLRIVDT